RKPSVRLSDEAGSKLSACAWRGNVRELQHTIEKAVIIADSDLLGPECFDMPAQSSPAGLRPDAADTPATTLEEMEYAMIKNTMDRFGGNLTLVAGQLGISRQTLYNKLKRYGL
ncbi:MAG: sigma-54-dependent Fis family transcriptional regulator, partial [Tannerellaceae bacterium]|nr:sigma-54-dependent Fis family transcriptional regulator [Tannerellaceae bacterium]